MLFTAGFLGNVPLKFKILYVNELNKYKVII